MQGDQSIVRYKCELLFEDYPNYKDIQKAIIDLLGEEKSGGSYNQASIWNQKEIGITIQVKLNQSLFVSLQKCLDRINVKFEDIFKRDLRHYHLEVNYNDEDHEGIAVELEDQFWELYYEAGPLAVKLKQSDEHLFNDEHGFFIEKIPQTAINQAQDIFEKFVVEKSK